MSFLWVTVETALAAEDSFAPLRAKLIAEGFDSSRVSLLLPPRATPMFKLVSQTFIIRESKLNYDQFLQPAVIAKARDFLVRHASLFTRAEETYGVDRSVIVAILLVETQLGHYTGKTPTLDVFSTYALMDQKHNRDKIWAMLAPRERKHWGREAFDRRLIDRSKWAYGELCALLRLADSHTVNLYSCRGSVMGAIGWPQFLPSSLVRYGVDGDGDGRIDLFEPADAILSVGSYLKGYGWCQAKTRTEKEDVIHNYNHSRPYVLTVLEIAERVKQ